MRDLLRRFGDAINLAGPPAPNTICDENIQSNVALGNQPPPCGEVEKCEGFFGGGAVRADGIPPPEISSLRYEISTSPQGGG
jgi:hypothetical protein